MTTWKLLLPSLRRMAPIYQGAAVDYLAPLILGGGDGEAKSKKDEAPAPKAKVNKDGKPLRFPTAVRESCWEKAKHVPGRHPSRFRYDRYGNVVCRRHTVGYGLTCFQYDHIIPISGTGESILANCEILLSRLNNFKNKFTKTEEEMIGESPHMRYTDEELDVIELNAFGDILRPGHTLTDIWCRCYSKREIWEMASIKWEDRVRACDEETEKKLVDYAVAHGLKSDPKYGKDST